MNLWLDNAGNKYVNDTLWLFNIAMENGPFIDGLPIKNGDSSMAMLNNSYNRSDSEWIQPYLMIDTIESYLSVWGSIYIYIHIMYIYIYYVYIHILCIYIYMYIYIYVYPP